MANIEQPGSDLELVPIERMHLPPSLDGRNGTNRVPSGSSLLQADDDVAAVFAWLDNFSDSPRTYQNYRKEAERLLLWAVIERNKPLSSLKHEDFLAYMDFLKDPRPRARWVLKTLRREGRDSPQWRPFVGPLSKGSQRQALNILNGLFGWLVQSRYLAGNPLGLQRTRNSQPSTHTKATRFLDEDAWREVLATIKAMPRLTQYERQDYERTRWLFTLLYLTGLRLTEVTDNTMGSFECIRGADHVEYWRLQVMSKGENVRTVPATSELMAALRRYRQANGLLPLPTTDESTGLVLAIGSTKHALKRGMLGNIVKTVFTKTAKRVQKLGDTHAHVHALLVEASTHWVRHTAGASMISHGTEFIAVCKYFGYPSSVNADRYLHVDENTRHEQTVTRHKLVP